MAQYTKDIFNVAQGPGRAIADPREAEARAFEASQRAAAELQSRIQGNLTAQRLQSQGQQAAASNALAEMALRRDQLRQQDRQFQSAQQFQGEQNEARRFFEERMANAQMDFQGEQSLMARSLQDMLASREADLRKALAGQDADLKGRMFDAQQFNQDRLLDKEQGFRYLQSQDQRAFAERQAQADREFRAGQGDKSRAIQQQIADYQGERLGFERARYVNKMAGLGPGDPRTALAKEQFGFQKKQYEDTVKRHNETKAASLFNAYRDQIQALDSSSDFGTIFGGDDVGQKTLKRIFADARAQGVEKEVKELLLKLNPIEPDILQRNFSDTFGDTKKIWKGWVERIASTQ